MFPLGDASRRPIRYPVMTLALIIVNSIVFIIELVEGDPFINRFMMVPANIVAGKDWYTIYTSMFMHAGWEHIIGNMIFFWAFGPQVEDVMGRYKYLIFYLLGGTAAAFAEIAADPTSTIPSLGASGAIAAVMGAFLVTYPRDQIRTVVFILWFGKITYIPSVVLIGLWFLSQVFSQIGTVTGITTNEGVAYMAHIGGFIFGAVGGPLFESRELRQEEGLE
ncbi:MAG TPA: rhomboid family intramembrane serine protease [Anaerolineaceae bacterium]|nr:rhomboid family intramembrane serine protease [Anaerolineaceae bacterium]